MTWFSSDGTIKVSQLAVSGSQVTIVGTTPLPGIARRAYQSWIYSNRIIIPFAARGHWSKTIGIWAYPKGGKAIKHIDKFGSYKKSGLRFEGLAISLPPS